MDNVSPLGGKSSMGASAVVAAEVKALKAYRADLDAVGPVNSNESARAMRRVMLKHASPQKRKAYAALFASLGLQA